jgi:hypothetical protein
MENRGFFPDGFSAAIVSAGSRARLETLKAGIPVFYWDWKQNLDVAGSCPINPPPPLGPERSAGACALA